MTSTTNEFRKQSLGRVTAAASIGTLFEWYDFFLSSTVAAIVWPFIFFNFLSGFLAISLSIITFAVTFFTRPIGAYIFGHMGDRVGRKSTLIWTLVVMGIGVFGIALTPNYVSIGIVAPLLIILWRLIFGIGLGGEYGGAMSWVIEYAKDSKLRSVWVGLVQMVNPLGIALSAISISILTSSLSRPAFLSWGWRVPFVIGGIALIFGLLFRYFTAESKMFDEVKKAKKIERWPASRVIKEYPKRTFALAFVTVFSVGLPALLLEPYSVAFLTANGLTDSFVTGAVALGAGAGVIACALGSYLATKIGRKLTQLVGIVGGLVFVFPFFFMVGTLAPLLVYLAYIIIFVVDQIGFGALAVLGPEQYPTVIRYSGTGMSYQIGTLFVGILLITVVSTFEGVFGTLNAWPYMTAVFMVFLVIGAVSLKFLREGKDVALEETEEISQKGATLGMEEEEVIT